MSWLSRATGIKWDVGGDISKGAKALTRNPAGAISGGLQHFAEQTWGRVAPGQKYENTVAPLTVDKPAEQILTEQQKGYQDYMKRLPSFQRQMAEGLAKESMQTMTGQQRQAEQRNVARGLGYGALNEAAKEQIRSQNQQQLASAIQQGNLGLLGLGEQMQAGIVTTGAGMQADLQNRYNQLYQQRLAEMQRQSSAAGQFLGAAGTIIGAVYGGPAGAAAGGAAGSAIGSQVR